MSEIVKQIEQLEYQKSELKKQAELGDMAIKLNGNHEFRKLILQHFMIDDCARYAQLMNDQALDQAGRDDATAHCHAAGQLRRWLSIQIQKANTADDTIVQIEANIAELRAMEDSE